MKSARTVMIAAALALALEVPGALAEDVAPAPYRGEPGSTTQQWDFMTAGEPLGPETVYYPAPDGTGGITDNPYGVADLEIMGVWMTHDPAAGPGNGGAWFDYEIMDIVVPNQVVPPLNTWKDIRIQITYYDPTPDPVPPRADVSAGPNLVELVDENVVPLGPDWYVLVKDWRIAPNPQEELVMIDNPHLGQLGVHAVGEVVIDTVCVPEPATVVLVTCGGLSLGLARRRRRRRSRGSAGRRCTG